MDITLDKKGNTEASIRISLKEEDYQPSIDQKIKEYRKQVNLKGFRPGKVPAGLIKKMYGKAIKVEEINELLARKLPEYIQESNLKIVGEPMPDRTSVENIDWDNQSDFEFSYDVGYINDFTYEISKEVNITKYVIPVTEEKIDEAIENLKKRFGKSEAIEGASEKDDRLFGLLSAVADPLSEDESGAKDLPETNEATDPEAADTALTEEVFTQRVEVMDKELADLEEGLEQLQVRINQHTEDAEQFTSQAASVASAENEHEPDQATQSLSEDIDRLRLEAEGLQAEINSLKAHNDQEIEDSLHPIALGPLSDQQAAPFLGVKVNDEVYFDIRETFPEDKTVASLLNISTDEAAQVKGEYRYKVKRVSRLIPSELNQAFYDNVFGPDAAQDEASFREKVREALQDNYQQESDALLARDVRNYYVDHTDIDIPRDFLKRWIVATSKNEITEAQLEEEFDDYIKEMKWSLLSNKIAEDREIKVEHEQIKQKARESVFAQFGMMNSDLMNDERFDPIVDNYLQGENGNNYMRIFNQTRADKVLEEIKRGISIEEKEVTTEAFNDLLKQE